MLTVQERVTERRLKPERHVSDRLGTFTASLGKVGSGSLYALGMMCAREAIVERSRGALVGHLETFDAATRIVDNLKIRCQDERNENNG